MQIDGDKDTTTGIDDSEQLQPVEISIPDETSDKEVDTGEKKDVKGEGESQAKEKKPGRFQRRIDQLTERASEAETVADRLKRENEELKRKLDKTSGDLQVADRAAFNNHANNVEARLKQAKSDLVKAQNDGDAEKIADATAEVSRWGAEQSRVENWKIAHPEPDPKARRADPADDDGDTGDTGDKRKDTPRPVKMTPELTEFLERNQWFVPNTGEFDQEMHLVARRFATKLEAKMKAEGRDKEIGNDGYYSAIEQHMKRVFPDHEWDDSGGDDDVNDDPPPRSGLPKMGADHRQVSTRSQSNGDGRQQNGRQTKVTLTGEQRQFVRGMVDNGAYGSVNPATQKPWTYAEAEVRYAREVVRDKENQKQKYGG